MAKGIPVIGRAPDKKAKIINVDELGNLKVSQLESKLDGIENKLVALEQKLTDGSQKVTLSGTNYEVITLANALAITTDQLLRYRVDGTFAPGSLGDGASIEGWNKYNFHAFDITNTHDVEVTLSLYVRRLIGAGFAEIGEEIEIEPESVYRVTHIPYTSQAILEGKLSSDLSVSLKCSTAPTTGSITIQLIMWN